MSQYYYAVASLPMLFLEGETFPDVDEFLGICVSWMSSRDLQALQRATLDPGFCADTEPSALGAWYAFETELRNTLARQRASRLGVDEDRYVGSQENAIWFSTTEMESRVSEAMSAESPLRAEQLLDEYRWRTLDELAVGHYFDRDILIIYYLKLQILRRRATMNRQDGQDLFDATWKTIIDRYYKVDEAVENNA
ncbi:MAG: DUF2764 family protein [Spirochaetaceae bacterium]|nr:MAG: DUF2764 family protein [Spirochaetaceae bacterium]